MSSSPAYAAYFCEENVWHLAADPSIPGPVDERRAVFVSGPQGVAMWGQRAAAGRDPLLWDYHVFLLARAASTDPWYVWDLDTTLGMPLVAGHYAALAFRHGVPDEVAPRFRVVTAAEYRATFASDRSHMLDDEGHPLQPFPSWPAITGAGTGNNLARFRDMTDRGFVGTLHDLATFLEEYG